ncbi:hypothetical protein ACP4OV_012844 [Aristida adscensionis]
MAAQLVGAGGRACSRWRHRCGGLRELDPQGFEMEQLPTPPPRVASRTVPFPLPHGRAIELGFRAPIESPPRLVARQLLPLQSQCRQEGEDVVGAVEPDRGAGPASAARSAAAAAPSTPPRRQCIEVTPASKLSLISEDLCIGCGICVKVCPFNAIQIINLPSDLNKETTHRYGQNSFKLHRLPVPRPGQVLGLVGTNGIGKSTALKILAGKLKPNLGTFTDPPSWDNILRHFRGSELQKYFTQLLEDKMKAIVKPQYLDHIPKSVKGKVGDLLNKKDERKVKDKLCDMLDLNQVMDRNVSDLSGGELQRFAIAARAMEEADVYMFDEPSCYLDVKQRLKAAQVIRSLLQPKNYVIVVEHDLSILDYLSDYICCLYGSPGAYGVVTLPTSVREGINIFLNGFVPTENVRFRGEKLTFRVTESTEEIIEGETYQCYKYPTMMKTRQHLSAGQVKPDKVGDQEVDMPSYSVSYKPQELISRISFTVRELLHKKIPGSCSHAQFRSDVMKPLKIEDLMDRQVANLSGGQLQRIALCLCLGKVRSLLIMPYGSFLRSNAGKKFLLMIAILNHCFFREHLETVYSCAQPADIYLIDEPSAHLDSEQHLLAAKVIKRFILHENKTAFVVEHDFIMATYLADKVVVFEGKPSVDCTANAPETLASGMNRFLSHLDITFRTDPTTYRPRINKLGSTKDNEQKAAGCHYYLEKLSPRAHPHSIEAPLELNSTSAHAIMHIHACKFVYASVIGSIMSLVDMNTKDRELKETKFYVPARSHLPVLSECRGTCWHQCYGLAIEKSDNDIYDMLPQNCSLNDSRFEGSDSMED